MSRSTETQDKEIMKKSWLNTLKVWGTALLQSRDEEGEVHLLVEEWEHGLTYFRVLVEQFEAVCWYLRCRQMWHLLAVWYLHSVWNTHAQSAVIIIWFLLLLLLLLHIKTHPVCKGLKKFNKKLRIYKGWRKVSVENEGGGKESRTVNSLKLKDSKKYTVKGMCQK